MAEVAERAGISRATAYRYFPSQDALVAEVVLDETVRPGLAAVHKAAQSGEAAGERLDAVVRADHQLVTENEAAFRTAIRTMMLSEDADGRSAPSRPGNRLRYLAAAVRPVAERLGPERTERLVTALSLCVGLESVLVTKDVCGLSNEEAGEAKRWAAAALLRAALAEAGEADQA
jgi:AcrR family transcriptional regulator